MYGEGKGGKPLSVHELHFPTQQLQQYLKMYYGLQCINFHTSNVTNGYPNHWWYDHIYIMWHIPNSLRGSNVSLKLKNNERQRVGARSLARNTIEG
jgi:hypothetical protein